MNKYSSNRLIKNLSRANLVTISPLEMTVKNNKNQTKKILSYK